jgi:hypothetical protein
LEQKLFDEPNQACPKQPYPIYLLPNICSVGAPVRKVAPSGLQRCTQVKGATNKCPRKKKNLPHYHKPPKQRGRDPTHVRYTPPNICSVAATQSGVLLSQHTPKLAKKQKNKGCWLGKVTQKVIPRIK